MDQQDDNPGRSQPSHRLFDGRPTLQTILLAEASSILEDLGGGPDRGFDPAGFALWLLAGLRLFREPTPDYQLVVQQARRVATVVAFARCHGNVTHMAQRLGSSRRVVRQALKDAGLYLGRPKQPSIPQDGQAGE